MDASVMEKLSEVLDAIEPEQEVSMEDEEKEMYEAMEDKDRNMYAKMNDEDKMKYKAMEDEERMGMMHKMHKAHDEEEVEKGEDAESTGSSSAEERLDDIDEIQQENIDEIAKIVNSMIGKSAVGGNKELLKIQKQLQARQEKVRHGNVEKSVEQLTDIVGKLTEQNKTIMKAFENMTDAMGIKDEVVKTIKKEKVEKAPVASDATSVGREIAKALREEIGGNPEDKTITKTIRDDNEDFMKSFRQIFKSNQDATAI